MRPRQLMYSFLACNVDRICDEDRIDLKTDTKGDAGLGKGRQQGFWIRLSRHNLPDQTGSDIAHQLQIISSAARPEPCTPVACWLLRAHLHRGLADVVDNSVPRLEELLRHLLNPGGQRGGEQQRLHLRTRIEGTERHRTRWWGAFSPTFWWL